MNFQIRARIILLAFLILNFFLARAQFGPPEIYYHKEGDSITVYGGSWSEWAYIPATIEGLPVTRIADGTFYSEIMEVRLPETVVEIGPKAFAGCVDLTWVEVHTNNPAYVSVEGVLYNKDKTFLLAYPAASTRESYTIPATVTNIEPSNFIFARSLSEINVAASNQSYTSAGGVLFDKGQTDLIRFPAGKPAATYSIPSSVRRISDFAFAFSPNLTQASLGDNVVSLGKWAFQGCYNLAGATIGHSVTNLPDRAFLGCFNMRSITIGRSVVSIGDEAFSSCGGLNTILLGEGVVSIGALAFSGCSELRTVDLPAHLQTIGNGAFRRCNGLQSLDFPASLRELGEDVFLDCWGIKAFNVAPGNQFYKSDAGVLFDKAGSILIKYPPQVNRAAYMVPEGVVRIAKRAFEWTLPLTSVTIPDSVEVIEDSAFARCQVVAISLGKGLKDIGASAFEFSPVTNMVVPDSVVSIGTRAFAGSGLTTLELGAGVARIESAAFGGCVWLEAIDLPDNVLFLGDDAFAGSGLTNILLGKGITTIGAGVFRQCPNLSKVDLPDHIVSIGEFAFHGCAGLTNVTIPNSVLSIQGNAFSECGGLSTLTLGNGLTSIGEAAFSKCARLGRVVIPDSVISIGGNAFAETSLSELTLGSNVVTIGTGAFRDCVFLSHVTLPSSVRSIEVGAFRRCRAMKTIQFNEGLLAIGTGAFSACIIENLSIPNSVQNVGDGAFSVNENLQSLVLGNGLTNIGEYAFYYAQKLTNVQFSSNLRRIGDNAFRLCNSLSGITIPDSLEVIGMYAFSACNNLKTVVIGNGCIEVNAFAFENCPNLSQVTFGTNLTAIRYGAFTGSGLTNIIIPASVAIIEHAAFAQSAKLQHVYFEGAPPELPPWWLFPSITSDPFYQSLPTVYYFQDSAGWGATYSGRPTMLWEPALSATLHDGAFGLTITGGPEQAVVLEASPAVNGQPWIPLATNTLTGAAIVVTDPDRASYATRFYRLRGL